MTTSVRIRREQVRSWPVFQENQLISNDMWAVSVEVERPPGQPMRLAVEAAVDTVRPAIESLDQAVAGPMALVVVGRKVSKSSRVAMHYAERGSPWREIEESGIVLPDGERNRVRILDATKELGFGGAIIPVSGDLGLALEVTRLWNSICVTVKKDRHSTLETFLSSLADFPERKSDLLNGALQALGAPQIVCRAFGEFDDSTAGVDVFAHADLADRLEVVLRHGHDV